MQALWIGPSTETLDRTMPVGQSYFNFRFVNTSDFKPEVLEDLAPGHPVVLEFGPTTEASEELTSRGRNWIDEIVRAVVSPVITCCGNGVSGEVVVDWIRRGVFSYVEQSANLERFQRVFESAAFRSQEVRGQYRMYEKLSQLWNSISPREVAVLDMIMDGLPNKKIANRLGVSQRTIEARRQNSMKNSKLDPSWTW